MEKWQITAIFLWAFGLFKEFKPSEPFFYEYAVDCRNFTEHYMIHDILPITTYGSLFSMLIILFITDFLRYKSVIVFGSFSALVSWVISIWAYDNIPSVQMRQILQAVSISSDIAYITYMYANVERSHYKIVTSFTHAALHAGRFLGSVTGQVLLSYELMELDAMNYLTLGGVGVALAISSTLPPVEKSIYFYPRHSVSVATLKEMGGNLRPTGFKKRVKRARDSLWNDFKKTYSNRYILKWCIWWSVASGIYFQVGIFIEPLWRHIEEETNEIVLNGAVDGVQALLSAVLGITVAYIKVPWFKYGEIFLSLISLIQGGALLVMSQAHNLYLTYAGHIVFQTLFQVIIIIATAEVADGLNEDSEAFIFGLNTLFALFLQSILTFTVAGENGLRLNIREEFVVYGAASTFLALIFLIISLQSRRKFFELKSFEKNNAKNERYNGTVTTESIEARKSSIASIRF